MFLEPRIPPNTGNAIRMVAATGATLHLVEPLGFDLSEPKLKRAGLDYHDLASVVVPPDLDAASIAVPTVHHAAAAVPLLRRGVACLVEKPFASSLADGEAMLAAAQAWRLEPLPWQADLPLDRIGRTGFPKLVVSGAHHPAFDAVCDVLAQRTGAERAVITGAGHSVQRTGEPLACCSVTPWLGLQLSERSSGSRSSWHGIVI